MRAKNQGPVRSVIDQTRHIGCRNIFPNNSAGQTNGGTASPCKPGGQNINPCLGQTEYRDSAGTGTPVHHRIRPRLPALGWIEDQRCRAVLFGQGNFALQGR